MPVDVGKHPGGAPAPWPGELRLASRASPLALAQSRRVAAALGSLVGIECRIIEVRTRADEMIDRPLAEFGGKGLFVKELESAMLEGRADMAVHSLKDVPTALPEGLAIAAVLAREAAHDALLSREPMPTLSPEGPLRDFGHLGGAWRVGTGSLRRKSQLAHLRPGWQIEDLRGNIGTRMARLDAGAFDAIVLARAGLDRLSEDGQSDFRLSDLHSQRRLADISRESVLPCPGQGALCLECLESRDDLLALGARLNHAPSARCTGAERALATRFAADCHSSFAALAYEGDGRIWLEASLEDNNGKLLRAACDIAIAPGADEELVESAYHKLRGLGAPQRLDGAQRS